jgi:hypothetical protein
MTWIDEKYINLISCRLKNFKRKKSGLYNCSCPLCGDSQKNKLKARGFFIAKKGKWFYFCHNCGASKNFDTFLKDMDASLHKEYTVESWKEKNVHIGRTGPVIIPPKTVPPRRLDLQESNLPRLLDLPNSHDAVQFAMSRRIPEDKWGELLYAENFAKFASTIDPDIKVKKEPRFVIPFYDEQGNIIAAQGRSLEKNPEVRYITVRGEHDTDKWYGLWRKLGDEVFVVEGPIDSLFLPNCVASTGLSIIDKVPSTLKEKELIFVLDNEARNEHVMSTMEKLIDQARRVVILPSCIKQKDINDMVLAGMKVSGIIDMLRKYSYSGMEAKLRLTQWKKKKNQMKVEKS